MSKYKLPNPKNLPIVPETKSKTSKEDLKHMSTLIETQLKNYGVNVNVVEIHSGPVITRFEIKLEAGVKVQKITSLEGISRANFSKSRPL